MQLLLSCAKTMASASSVRPPRTTQPLYLREAEQLALRMAALGTDELARMLRINPRIAAENRLRYHRFLDPEESALAAITAYTGIVFKHLAPATFTPADFEYAQQHLLITSFLYGLLRPLDAIRPYRLEGDARVGNDDRTLYDYWRERLTETFLDRIRSDDGVLVNLASGEMKRLFDWPRIRREVRVITPEFRVREGDRLRTVVVYTKMCRGEMARQVLLRRISDPDHLKDFDWQGFAWDPVLSRGDEWVFTV
ncbi:YaaA family protein [Alistipes sp.]|uniref:YaaA family protein n=1 Tax=Alistipes sp. TaxID=1872444 RepID=UPI003AF1D00D